MSDEWIIINPVIPKKYLLSYYIYKNAIRSKIFSKTRTAWFCENN